MSDTIVRADAISRDDVTLIFDGAGKSEISQMMQPWERPGGRNNESDNAIFDSQLAVNLREPQIITDTEAQTQVVIFKIGKLLAR